MAGRARDGRAGSLGLEICVAKAAAEPPHSKVDNGDACLRCVDLYGLRN